MVDYNLYFSPEGSENSTWQWNEGLHPGAQLAVFKNGELVIELAGASPKALAAMVMLVLHDLGRFSFNDPVPKHWPEFPLMGSRADFHRTVFCLRPWFLRKPSRIFRGPFP